MKIKNLQSEVLDFSERRPILREFNNQPLVLSLAIIREAAELSEAELFNKERLGEELADLFIYLFEFANLYNINIAAEVLYKLAINELRLPEDMFQEGEFAETYMQIKKENGERK